MKTPTHKSPTCLLALAATACVALLTAGCKTASTDTTYSAPDTSLLGYFTDSRTRERYPLFRPEPAQLDPKWYGGVTHMLENSEPLPSDIAEHLTESAGK